MPERNEPYARFLASLSEEDIRTELSPWEDHTRLPDSDVEPFTVCRRKPTDYLRVIYPDRPCVVPAQREPIPAEIIGRTGLTEYEGLVFLKECDLLVSMLRKNYQVPKLAERMLHPGHIRRIYQHMSRRTNVDVIANIMFEMMEYLAENPEKLSEWRETWDSSGKLFYEVLSHTVGGKRGRLAKKKYQPLPETPMQPHEVAELRTAETGTPDYGRAMIDLLISVGTLRKRGVLLATSHADGRDWFSVVCPLCDGNARVHPVSGLFRCFHSGCEITNTVGVNELRRVFGQVSDTP